MAFPWIHLRHHGHDANYNYVHAEGGGGGYLRRNAAAPLEWESFGFWAPSPPRGLDNVALYCWNSNPYYFVCAEHGGGHHLIANRTILQGWETFRVRFVDGFNGRWSGSNDVIVSGDVISLQAASGHYVTCPTADGIMRADAGGVGPNERFTILAQGNQPRQAYWTWRDNVEAVV